MAELTLELSPSLRERLNLAANKEAKQPETLVLELLESFLESQPLNFIGAWADSDITPEAILEARTLSLLYCS